MRLLPVVGRADLAKVERHSTLTSEVRVRSTCSPPPATGRELRAQSSVRR